MIHVLAIITAKPGMREEVLGHFRANMAAVHAEDGCIEYGPAIDAEDEVRFHLPTRSRVLALPRATHVDDANFAYRSRYARSGALVTVQRQLKFRHTAATCTPEDYRRMRPALERMLRDLRSQVVVRRG